jgi:hypothetical protein
VKAALIGQILIRKGRIWIAKLRIDHVAIFRASAPRIFNAVALIVLAAAGGDLAAVIVSVAAVASAAAGLAGSAAVAGSEVGAEN